MAQNDGRREVVNDPLAVTGREVQPERSLALTGVRAPNNGGPGGAGAAAEQLSSAFADLEGAYAGFVEKKKEDWITEGKMAYMAGKTEADLIAQGNRFTHQGFLQLKVRDDVNKWFMEEAAGITDARNRMDPAEYQGYINQRRAEYLDGLTDPYARKIAAKSFEQYSPELVQQQFASNNEFNRNQRTNQLTELLSSTSHTSPSKSVVDENTPLRLSPTPVGPVMKVSERDRDIGIRTILGEAASQGATGQAAVAHVLRNRAVDGRWPSSITGVALQDKQFSAWNKGAGGNSLVHKYGPGSPAYEQAGKIFDAVMSGRHVDPTGGATHYYAPSGMTALVAGGHQKNTIPGWLKKMSAESGGTIKIGGHIFAGKAKMPSGPRAAVEGSDKGAAGVYAATGKKPGDDPIVDALADQKEREEGPAVDPALAARPGMRSGTLDELNAVAASEGVAVSGVDAVGNGTEVQELIRGYSGLNDSDKASALTTAVVNQLNTGDDTLYHDAGGTAMLIELGATPAQVQSVREAYMRHQKSSLDKYDAADEAWRAGILDRASKGDDLQTILSDIDKRVQSKLISDQEAQSLARSAAEKIRSQQGQSDPTDGNVDYLEEIGAVYQKIKTGALDFDDASALAKQIGAKYGAGDKEVQNQIGTMFQLDQQRQDKVRSDAEAAAKKYAENEAEKAKVAEAVGRGFGLSNVTGTIETVNRAGQKAKVPAEQYGADLIKDKHTTRWKERVDNGEVDEAEAVAGVIRDTMLELQKHGIVDKETQAQIVGALKGPIVSKDGSADKAAAQAYDVYKIIRDTPGISEGYLAKTVGDTEVRSLLETAYTLDGGNLTGPNALTRAHALLNDPLRNPDERLSQNVIWKQALDKKVRETIDAKGGNDFWTRIYKTPPMDTENARALSGADRAAAYVERRAHRYFLQNENIDPEVALKMGIQDLENNSTVIAGNLIVHPDRPLHEAMGLSSFGADAANEAVSEWLNEWGSTIWEYRDPENIGMGSAWEQYKRTRNPGAMLPSLGLDLFPENPAVKMTYNADNGTVTFDLYKDEKKGTLLGMERTFRIEDIGKAYKEKQLEKSSWSNMWDSIFQGAGAAAKALNTPVDELF